MPPLDQVATEDICGEIGPQHGDSGELVLRCTLRDPDHDGRHRHCREHRDRKWTPAYELETDDEGRVTGSYRPQDRSPRYGLPGPRPAQKTPDGVQAAQRLEAALDRLDQMRDAEPEHAPAQARSPANDVAHAVQLADVHRLEQLDALEEPLCQAVPWRDLEATSCRSVWIKAGEIHACTREDGHEDTDTQRPAPGRCQCACGRDRRATVYGPLEPTDRPEPELETGGSPSSP